MKLLKSGKAILDEGFSVILAPFRTMLFLREIVKEGCYLVETPFQYGETTYSIRTLIQLDADVLHILPSDKLWHDPQFAAQLKTYHHAHHQRLERISTVVRQNQVIYNFIFDASLLTANIGPLYNALQEPGWENGIISSASLIASGLLRKYGRRAIIKMVLKRVLTVFT